MLINSQTKIAALLKHHPDALEAIVTLSPDFKKLRNPILRKIMAGRTSISMASKIGGCTPDDFFKVLAPYGFEFDTSTKVEEEPEPERVPLPDFINKVESAQVITLDVRQMLAAGNDPLKLIQQTIKELNSEQVLKIINTFEPTPLIRLLEKQGFQSFTDFVNKDLIETYFYKTSDTDSPQEEVKTDDLSGDWDLILKKYGNYVQKIDVRHLEMPMPMMTILETLESLPADTALFVQHKRIPVYLLTELKDRNFDYRIKTISDSEVNLLIFRN
ncbi:MAG: DUF2249 domain-containing protein [Sphingobacteriaceae bacterium]